MKPCLALCAVALVLWIGTVPGCESPRDRVAAVAANANVAGRAATAAQLHTLWQAKKVTVDACIQVALTDLEEGKDASIFAGAVLDFLVLAENKLQHGGEFEIFWFRVGRVACAGAISAYKAGRVEEAASLVFAGPKRWQTEGYWIKYPDHDGLASIILAATGNRSEAIRRLEDRGSLEGDAAYALEILKSAR